ncbi:hypothetical protein HOB04_01130 [archaeon]|nr:hypothetical protein [archaeon]
MSKIERRGFGKRGLLSSFIAFFGATILIALILIVFVVGAGVVKKLNKVSSDVAIYNESMAEIDNVFSYSGRYVNLSEVKFLVASDLGVEDSLRMVKYEK